MRYNGEMGTGGRRIISFSLFGAIVRYTAGMLANVELAERFFPGWTCRVYHDHTVPSSVLRALSTAGAELVEMAPDTFENKAVWRFLVHDDPDVHCWIS